jgi:exonuclease III
MKIATWNIERLKHKAQLGTMPAECERVAADILVLTETGNQVKPNFKHCFRTSMLSDYEGVHYNDTERRVSIFTNYKCVNQYPTYDEQTALCVELETERGNLLVYGTIIGIQGNRRSDCKKDLIKQLADIERLAADNHNVCVCGDFNCTFADNYYYTKFARSAMTETFAEHGLALLTKDRPQCIDHIAVSEKFVGDSTVQIYKWNNDKKLSDHKGIMASII